MSTGRISNLILHISLALLCTAVCSFANPVKRATDPETTDIINFPIQNISGTSRILPLAANDADGNIVSFKILTLPSASQGTLYLNAIAVTVGQVITFADAAQLQFASNAGYSGNFTFTYTSTDNSGATDLSPATYTIPIVASSESLVCNGQKGPNILGAEGTFSSPFIVPNVLGNCLDNNASVNAPTNNVGQAKPALTSYAYASTSGGLGPEGRYSFLKTLGTTGGNCIKGDWRGSDHTGDGGYFMAVNGAPDISVSKTFFTKTVSVCPYTLYEFSAFLIKVVNAGGDPNIVFKINGTVIAVSGDLGWKGQDVWTQFGGLWYSGSETSVTLAIENNTVIASGNDLGLDDISMAICGPSITYPNLDLNPKFCSYGVLPLAANVKSSISTYSSYMFQRSTDGGINWTDISTALTAHPTYVNGMYEYAAVFGDIPIDPSMNGYQYRLKVATTADNLVGNICNVFADQVITINTFTKPSAGADIVSCNAITTANLAAAQSGETWSASASNPVAATIQQNGQVSGLTVSGVYEFYLSNSAGCIDAVQIIRSQVSSAGNDTYICSNQDTYKLADAPAGYQWDVVAGNPSAAIVDANTGAVSNMTVAGDYQFMLVSVIAGCTDIVKITKATAITLSESHSPVLCYGGNSNITLTATGGSGNYEYKLGINGVYQTSNLFTLSAGSYTFYVKDGNTCESLPFTLTITQPAAALSIAETHQPVKCFGEATGTINISMTGGTAPYTYAWSNGAVTEDLSGLTSGSYTLTVTDANGCLQVQTIVITQPAAALSIAETHQPVKCFGEATGTINISMTGGTAPYTYAWSNGAVTEDLSGLTSGSYTLTVTDANGCLQVQTIVITQPAAALSIAETHQPVKCFGEATGTINISMTGGTAPYTYAWSNGAVTEDLSGLTSGSYTLTVTDANGCLQVQTIVITQPAAALSIAETHQPVKCFGEATGTINISMTGGTAPYTYAWSNGAVTEDLSGLTSGSYTLTVTDANGCLQVQTIVITQPAAALSIAETHQPVKCFGEATGTINISMTGGTAPYTYAWSNGAVTEDLSGLTSGSYTLTVTDANGCLQVQTIVITQPAAALSIAETHQPVKCFGEATGTINISMTGGTAPYTYAWSNGAVTEDLSGLTSGSYTLTVTDANGCLQVQTIVITQPAAALSIAETHQPVKCFGEATGTINSSMTGGTAPYTYA